MSSLVFLWTFAACLITGAALYVTRGVLDQVLAPDGAALRVALLPPWQALAGFVCLTALLLVWVDHLNRPRATTSFRRPRLGELAMPLVALVALLVPYAPVLPDRWPVLQVLAGPLRGVVWVVVAVQLLWVLWQARLITARWIERWTIGRVTVAIWVGTALLSSAAAARLTGTTLFPGGDEPHYLVMAQSLWRDHDLKIENNHARGDYHEYFQADLEPHYLTCGIDGEIYSVHPVGLPLLVAPVYGAGGYRAVVWLLIAMAATAAAMAWWWTVGALNAPGAATFAWAAIAGSAPFLFNTFTVYPEVAAALAVMIALVLAVKADPRGAIMVRWLALGAACGTLPWLSTKYAPMSAVLVAVAVGRAFVTGSGTVTWKNAAILAIIGPYAASVSTWLAFFYVYWGSPWPQAPYGALTQTTPANMLVGAPGLLFDQEYGLLAYAPVYVLACTGLLTMWRAGGDLRRQSVEIAAVFGSLLATVGAFGIWWGGSAAPARPLASGLLVLALPIAAAFRAAPAASPRRAGQHLLLWVGVGMAITLAFAQDGLLINNGRDGTSALIEWWWPRGALTALAPSFVQADAWIAYLQSAWWLAIAGSAGFVLSRWRIVRPGGAALAACGTFATALLVVAATFPWLPASGHRTSVDLRARSRLAALDAFDALALPVAVVYDPLRTVPATGVLPSMTLVAAPGLRTDQQPLRVIHNGRFSLPAGTYDIEVAWGDRVPPRPLPFSIQIGRIGPPLATWNPDPQPGGRWLTTLAIPVDASFVGFRGSLDLERSVTSVTITPTAIVDRSARPRVPLVLAASRYADTTLFFHDEQLFPEPDGFWTIGKRQIDVTVTVPAARSTPVVLRVHCGLRANRFTIGTKQWERTFDLAPGAAQLVTLPLVVGGVLPLTMTTEDGFSPSQMDASSQDRRFLGVWVEVVKE